MSDSKKVDAYIKKHEPWGEQLGRLRELLLAAGLSETIKWGSPTYTLDGKNLIGLAAFRNHCALWFHSGSFLVDKDRHLHNAQEGRTRGMRQWRFEAGDRIPVQKVKAYIKEAIANERAGMRIKPKVKPLIVPMELEKALGKNRKLKQAFDKLTPGKQREYADHIASAKQEATRISRLEKVTPMILKGAGLNDRYKNC